MHYWRRLGCVSGWQPKFGLWRNAKAVCRLTLELPSEEAERLLRLVEEGELREFYVESARQLIKRSRTPSIKYLESVDEPNVSFKRQWDAGLQAELDAALADFDESSFNAPSARSGKSAGPRKIDDRGQEGRPGTRTGKVIGIAARRSSSTSGARARGFCRSPISKRPDPCRAGRPSRSSSNGSIPRKACRSSA